MFPRENLKKWCNLVRLGVNFAAICLKKIVKIFIFYIKIIDIVLLCTIFRGIRAYSPERVFFGVIWYILEYIFRGLSLKKIYRNI